MRRRRPRRCCGRGGAGTPRTIAHLLPRDPRSAELLRRLRDAGHTKVAEKVEGVLRSGGKLQK